MTTEMATPKRCSVCKKEWGPIYCTGCDAYLCMKDFKLHRDELSTKMDGVVEERNRLQDEINNVAQPNDQQNPLIEQIDQWQKVTIEKVKQVAAQARQQAIQLVTSKQEKITTEFQSFSQELAHLKESENYVEPDLTRLSQMINQLKQDLRQSTQQTTIILHTEQSDGIDWGRFIYVEEIQTNADNRERQKQTTRKFIKYFSWTNIDIVIFFKQKVFQLDYTYKS